MCEGLTVEELQHTLQKARPANEDKQTMKFTYKRSLFSTTKNAQELIVPASTRAVKVNKFASNSLQVYTADERVSAKRNKSPWSCYRGRITQAHVQQKHWGLQRPERQTLTDCKQQSCLLCAYPHT